MHCDIYCSPITLLSLIHNNSYLAALNPTSMLLIFGLTPTADPPTHDHNNNTHGYMITAHYTLNGHMTIYFPEYGHLG